jgi:hypothetical protein
MQIRRAELGPSRAYLPMQFLLANLAQRLDIGGATTVRNQGEGFCAAPSSPRSRLSGRASRTAFPTHIFARTFPKNSGERGAAPHPGVCGGDGGQQILYWDQMTIHEHHKCPRCQVSLSRNDTICWACRYVVKPPGVYI